MTGVGRIWAAELEQIRGEWFDGAIDVKAGALIPLGKTFFDESVVKLLEPPSKGQGNSNSVKAV